MARVGRKIGDRRLLKLIGSYLRAGIMVEGVKQASAEGTPQGSPLSPLLANIMLDDLDRELGQRGHHFVRYADDLRVYVRSERAAERTLASITDYLERRLRLKVNREKSSVRPAGQATLLGFGLIFFGGAWRICVEPKALSRVRRRIRIVTARKRSISMEQRVGELNRYIAGWSAYFHVSEDWRTIQKLDKWLRRRLRQVRWQEWKRIRTRIRELRRLGASPGHAVSWGKSSKGPWPIAGSGVLQTTLTNAYWRDQGLEGFMSARDRLRRS
jgi:group II intron reverse transcriptase/maturase